MAKASTGNKSTSVKKTPTRKKTSTTKKSTAKKPATTKKSPSSGASKKNNSINKGSTQNESKKAAAKKKNESPSAVNKKGAANESKDGGYKPSEKVDTKTKRSAARIKKLEQGLTKNLSSDDSNKDSSKSKSEQLGEVKTDLRDAKFETNERIQELKEQAADIESEERKSQGDAQSKTSDTKDNEAAKETREAIREAEQSKRDIEKSEADLEKTKAEREAKLAAASKVEAAAPGRLEGKIQDAASQGSLSPEKGAELLSQLESQKPPTDPKEKAAFDKKQAALRKLLEQAQKPKESDKAEEAKDPKDPAGKGLDSDDIVAARAKTKKSSKAKKSKKTKKAKTSRKSKKTKTAKKTRAQKAADKLKKPRRKSEKKTESAEQSQKATKTEKAEKASTTGKAKDAGAIQAAKPEGKVGETRSTEPQAKQTPEKAPSQAKGEVKASDAKQTPKTKEPQTKTPKAEAKDVPKAQKSPETEQPQGKLGEGEDAKPTDGQAQAKEPKPEVKAEQPKAPDAKQTAETPQVKTETDPKIQAVQDQFNQQMKELGQDKIRDILDKSFTDKDPAELDKMAKDLYEGKGSLPDNIDLVDRATLEGHDGAYVAATGEDKSSMLLANDLKGDKLLATYSEELGHHLDSRLGGDSQGDEGQAFQATKQAAIEGREVSAQQMESIRENQDQGTLEVDGKEVKAEFRGEAKTDNGEEAAKAYLDRYGAYMTPAIAADLLSGKNSDVPDSALPHIADSLRDKKGYQSSLYRKPLEKYDRDVAMAKRDGQDFLKHLESGDGLSDATRAMGRYADPIANREHYRAFADSMKNLKGLDSDRMGRLTGFLDSTDPATGRPRRESPGAELLAEKEGAFKAVMAKSPEQLGEALKDSDRQTQLDVAKQLFYGDQKGEQKSTFDMMGQVSDPYGQTVANFMVEQQLKKLPPAQEFSTAAYKDYYQAKGANGKPRWQDPSSKKVMDRVEVMAAMKGGDPKKFADSLKDADPRLKSDAIGRVKDDFAKNPEASSNLLRGLGESGASSLADLTATTTDDKQRAFASKALLEQGDTGYKALGERYKTAEGEEKARLAELATSKEVVGAATEGSKEAGKFLYDSMRDGSVKPTAELVKAAAGGDQEILSKMAEQGGPVGKEAVRAMGDKAPLGELVERKDGVGATAAQLMAEQGQFDQLRDLTSRDDETGRAAVQALAERGGEDLSQLVSGMKDLPPGSRAAVLDAVNSRLDTPEGRALATQAMDFANDGFRRDVYSDAAAGFGNDKATDEQKAYYEGMRDRAIQEIKDGTFGQSFQDTKAVSEMLRTDPGRLEEIAKEYDQMGRGGQDGLKYAVLGTLKSEGGQLGALELVQRDDPAFRERLYSQAQADILEQNVLGSHASSADRYRTKSDRDRENLEKAKQSSWIDKDFKVTIPDNYQKFADLAVKDMGSKGDVGGAARGYLGTAANNKVFAGGSLEKFHSTLVEHEKKGGYLGGEDSYRRLDRLRSDVETGNKFKGPEFDEDLRKMGLNDKSYKMLSDRMRAFPEDRPQLYARMQQLQDMAVAQGDEKAQERLKSVRDGLGRDIDQTTRFSRENKENQRVDFDRVEAAFDGLRGGKDLKGLEGLSPAEYDYAKARLESFDQSPQSVLKELHDKDPARYRETLNALNKTEAGNIRQDVQGELQRIANDPFDPQFDHPDLRDTINSNQVVPHASRLAQTWGLEGGNDQVQTQALQAQGHYGDESVRNLKSRTDSWNAMSPELRSEMMFGEPNLDRLSKEQRAQLDDLSLQGNFEAMANGELTGQAKDLLTGDPPLEDRVSKLRADKVAEFQREMTIARRSSYLDEDSKGLLLGYKKQIGAAEDQKKRLNSYRGELTQPERQRLADDFTDRAKDDPKIKALSEKLESGEELTRADKAVLNKELDSRIEEYKKRDEYADVIHNDPHWLLDAVDLFSGFGNQKRYSEQQKQMIGQLNLNERNSDRRQAELAKLAGDIGQLDQAQLAGTYEKAKAYGNVEAADKMALDAWKKHGADLKDKQPGIAADMESKGDSALGEGTWDRLARQGKVDSEQAWDKPDATNFRDAMRDYERAGQGTGTDGIEGQRQRALESMLQSEGFKDVTDMGQDLAKTYGSLQDMINGGLTGSPMPAFIDKVRGDAAPLYDKLNKFYESGGVEKAQSQLRQMEAMRDRMAKSGDKTGLAELDKNIGAMKSMMDVVGAGPDKGIHAMLKTALDPSKMHADTWGNFVKHDGIKVAGAIGGAVAGAVIIGATLGAGTPFVVAAGAMALGGAAGGLIGGELGSEANSLIHNSLGDGPVKYGDRSRLGAWAMGDKILDPRTMEYREAKFGADVALPYTKQFLRDAAIQFGTMGLAKGFGAGVGKLMGNPNLTSQLAGRAAAVEAVYGKEVAKKTMTEWTKQMGKQMGKEFTEELGDEALEHVVQNGLNDIHPGLGMASSLLVATGRSSIDATRVANGDYNIDYNGADAGHVRTALEASGFNVETNSETGLITAKNKKGETVTFKPAGENPSLNWDTPQQTLSQAEAKMNLANKMSTELQAMEPGSEAYTAKQAEIQQLQQDASALDARVGQTQDAGTRTPENSRDPQTATERQQVSKAEGDLQALKQEHGDGPHTAEVQKQIEAAESRVESSRADLAKEAETSQEMRLDNADKPPTLSTEEVQQMKQEDWSKMIPKAVDHLSPQALENVSVENLTSLSPKAYDRLPDSAKARVNQAALDSTPEAFGQMSADMVNKLPASTLNQLSPEHMAQLSTQTVAGMNQDSLNDLSTDRLNAIPRPGKTVSGKRESRVADYRLSEAAKTHLDRAQANPESLTTDQVRDLVTVADRHGSYETRHQARALMAEKGLTQADLFGGRDVDTQRATEQQKQDYQARALEDATQQRDDIRSERDAVGQELKNGVLGQLGAIEGRRKALSRHQDSLNKAKATGDAEAIARAEAKIKTAEEGIAQAEAALGLDGAELSRKRSEREAKVKRWAELDKQANQAHSALPKIESGELTPTPPGKSEEAQSPKDVLGKDYKLSETGWTDGKPGDAATNLQEHFEKHVLGGRDNGMKISEFNDPANPLPGDLTFKTADGREVAYSDIKTAEEYSAAARNFVSNPDQFPGTEMVVKPNGDVHYYNPNLDLEAMTDPNGNMRTFFRSKMVDHQQGYDHWIERTQSGTAADTVVQRQAPADTSRLTIKSDQLESRARDYLTDMNLDPKMLDDVSIHRGVDGDGRQINTPHVVRDENGQISMFLPENQNEGVRAHDFGHELDHVIALKQGGEVEGSLREANDAALKLRELRQNGGSPEAIAEARETYRDTMAEHEAEARGHRFVGWQIDQLAQGNKPKSGKPQSPKLNDIQAREEGRARTHEQRVAELQATPQFESDPKPKTPLNSLQRGADGQPLGLDSETDATTTPEAKVEGAEQLMLDSFSRAEFSDLNPGQYHDAQHALNVANTVNGMAQNMGRSPERAKFLSEVALLHDADERVDMGTGQQGDGATPASVHRTLEWMDGNRQALQDRMGWDNDQFAEAQALIARTDYPFGTDPINSGTKFDGQSAQQTYEQLLAKVPAEQRAQVLEDGQLLRFADQTGNYTGSRAEAERYVEGLHTELNNVGAIGDTTREQLRAGTPGFMQMAGQDSDGDVAIAKNLGIDDAQVFSRDQLLDALPESRRRNLEANQESFKLPQFDRAPKPKAPLTSLERSQDGQSRAVDGQTDTAADNEAGVRGLMRDSFTQAEFEALNPGQYHDPQHALNVANTVNGVAQNMGRTPERSKFLSQVALLHDADERVNMDTGKQGDGATPASVHRTLEWMDGNQESLQERMGWDANQFAQAKALIARTDFPFADTPVKSGTKYDGQSAVETYKQLLSDLPADQRAQVLEDGQIMRFADQTGNYTGTQAEAERYVKGLHTELSNIGVPGTYQDLRTNTPNFMESAGDDGHRDTEIAKDLGIEGAKTWTRQELLDSLPANMQQNLERNQEGFTRPLEPVKPLRLDNDTGADPISRRAAGGLRTPDGTPIAVPSDGTPIVLGRTNGGADVSLGENNLKVSRKHAEMRMENGQLQIKNVSQNGTLVDGEQVSSQEWTNLEPGAAIKMGDQFVEVPFFDRGRLESGQPTQLQMGDGTSATAQRQADGSIRVENVQETVTSPKDLKAFKPYGQKGGWRSWLPGGSKMEVGKQYVSPKGEVREYLGTDSKGGHQFGEVSTYDSPHKLEQRLRQDRNNNMAERQFGEQRYGDRFGNIRGNKLPGDYAERGDRSGPIASGTPYQFTTPDGRALNIPTDGSVGKIGRNHGLSDPKISGEHAEVKVVDGRMMVRDMGSTNGTYLDGRRLEKGEWTALPDGASFRLGQDLVVRPHQRPNVGQASALDPSKSVTEPLSSADAAGILSQMRVSPAEFQANGVDRVTPESLKAAGLEPSYKMKLGGSDVFLSKPYDLGGGRKAYAAYVLDPKTGEYNYRSFYQSNSQGVWRSASHGAHNSWIGKGSKDHGSESSTNLPVEMQKELHRLSGQGQPQADLNSGQARQAFYGGLPNIGMTNAPAEFTDGFSGVTELGHFADKGNPGSFQFAKPGYKPSFENGPSDSYTFQHPTHGKVQAEVFPSQDGSLDYVFFRDPSGRAWISQVDQSGGDVTGFGVRSQAVDAGGLDTPAVEYPQQIRNGYRGENLPNTQYAENTAYTNQIPVIQDYLRWVNNDNG